MISSAVTPIVSSRWRNRRLDRGGLGRRGEPLGEPGALGAPIVGGKAKIEVTQRAGDRHAADSELALERLGLGLELGQRAVDFLHLAVAPVGPALVLGPQIILIARQQ